MATIGDIYNFIDEFAPFKKSLDYDNVGVLIGDKSINVSKVLVALDITDKVIDEAVNLGANLIISHHPIIFKPMKKISSRSLQYNLIKNEISVISAHTNLDLAKDGVNKCLFDALKLKDGKPLMYKKVDGEMVGFGLRGKLDRTLSASEFAQYVKESLNCDRVRFTNLDKKVRTVAVCGGAGGDLFICCVEKEIDAFVTGEIKHSEILESVMNGLAVVDAGHFKTENVVINPFVKLLQERFKDTKFKASNSCTDTIKYI